MVLMEFTPIIRMDWGIGWSVIFLDRESGGYNDMMDMKFYTSPPEFFFSLFHELHLPLVGAYLKQ